jgi:hypothetical protein
MRNVYDDDGEIREARRWWLRSPSSYEPSSYDMGPPTSPKLKSAQFTTGEGNRPLWQGFVVEEGTTLNGDRWFYVMFTAIGVPYSVRRQEAAEAVFVEVEAARGAPVFQERGKTRARVQFLVSRNNSDKPEKKDVEGQWPTSMHRYGPYVVSDIKGTNKWEIVQIAIDKALRKWLRTPVMEEHLDMPDADLIFNLDWVSEVAFPDMDRSFKGVEP